VLKNLTDVYRGNPQKFPSLSGKTGSIAWACKQEGLAVFHHNAGSSPPSEMKL
jgi:hypothetical protein